MLARAIATSIPVQLGHFIVSRQKLHIFQFDEATSRYMEQGLAFSTREVYEAIFKTFPLFGLKYSVNATLPVSEKLICHVVTYLPNKDLSPQSITMYPPAV